MGRACTICVHSAYAAIDAALETDRSLRDIAAEFGVSKTALQRHRSAHIVGESSAVPSTGTLTKTKPRSRIFIIVKWALIVGFALMLLNAARHPDSGQISQAKSDPTIK